MRVQFHAVPKLLGYGFNVQATAWDWDMHRLVYSKGHRRVGNRWSGQSGFLVHHQGSSSTSVLLPEYTYLGNKHGGLAVPVGTPLTQPSPPSSPAYSDEEGITSPYGAKGWARARPGNPVANAGQFVAELRKLPAIPLLDGVRDRILRSGVKAVPRLLLGRLASFRRLGGEYLNLQFGWAPFVRDLQEMHQLSLDIDRRIARLRHDNGRSLKRTRILVDSTEVQESSSVVNGPFSYLTPTPIIIGGGRSTRSEVSITKERIWFVGRFRYFVPNIGSPQWRKRAVRALYGGELTPSLAWELLPWSWLIDWFSNVGDVLSNMSANAVDNTIADYAYVMRTSHTETNVTVQTSWGGRSGTPAFYPAGEGFATLRTYRTTKSRVVASPYGFGLTYDGLSAFQMSILAALGVSRSRFPKG